MDAPAEFESALRNALGHLFDPTYRPASCLSAIAGWEGQRTFESLRPLLIEAIESLRPGPEVPLSAREWRLYDLLAHRYLQAHTQDETAERLGITSRHLRREQEDALQLLADRLWQHGSQGPVTAAAPLPGTPGGEWRSQVRQELAALQRSAPGVVADVALALTGALELARTVAAPHKVELCAPESPPGLVAAIHPSALRQALLTAISRLAPHVQPGGEIACHAEPGTERISITLAGSPVAPAATPDVELPGEILASQGGTLEVLHEGTTLTLVIQVPAAQRVSVLVVEDNLDLVHFYQRYTAETRYQIRHLPAGQGLFEAIEAAAPDIIVLDIMLPDADGWELLTYLRQYPATSRIPVIVCSVVREEELVLALGATLFLAKPVRRAEFVAALDAALGRAGT